MISLSFLQDIYELNLTPNPSYKDSEKYTDAQSAQYICPVTGLEMIGHHNFCFIQNCRCAISEKALKEVISETWPVRAYKGIYRRDKFKHAFIY